MTIRADAIDRAAMEWLVRVQDPTFDRWDDWEAWLIEAPAHADAYWRLAEDDAELVDPAQRTTPMTALAAPRRPTPRTGGVFARPVRRPRPGFGIGIAAAVVLACGIAWFALRPAVNIIKTAPGETRTVTLADGSTAHLAGATRLTLSANDRQVTLDQGRALFEAAAAAEPFTVRVADAEIVDLGTVFDVTRLEDGVRVSVAEGVVRFDGLGRSERLEAGDGVIARGDRVERTREAPSEVLAWRVGRLSYRDAPLALVAEDLGRAVGLRIEVAPSLAARPFSGSVDATGGAAAVRRRIEALLRVTVVEVAGGWRLEPAVAS